MPVKECDHHTLFISLFHYLSLNLTATGHSVNMPVKECDHHKKVWQCNFICLLFAVLIVIIILVVLITWLILLPKEPRFTLQDATINNFNLSAPVLLSSNFQVTVTSRNPNKRIGVYYDKLDIYATYHGQQITYSTELPPGYQGHKESITYSPFIYGTNVPVAPYNGVTLSQNQIDGCISLLIKINGRVRWKVGSFISGRYHLHVTCKADIPFSNCGNSIDICTGVKYLLTKKCSVSV